MRRFKSFRQVQRFLSIHATVHSHFRPRRHRLRLLAIASFDDNSFSL